MSSLHLYNTTSPTESNDFIREILSNGNIFNVEVSLKENYWVIHMKCDEILSFYKLSSFELTLLDCSELLEKVQIIPYYDLSMVDLKKIDTNLLTLIKENFAWFFPDFKIWLMNSNLEFTDQLEIQLPSKMGVEILCKDGINKSIQECLQKNFKLDLNVEVRAKKPKKAYAKKHDIFIKEYTQKIQQKLETKSNQDVVFDSKLIYGKPLNNYNLCNIDQLGNDQLDRIAVSGEIFAIDVIRLKSGNNMVSFNITDHNDTIMVKVFENDSKKIIKPLKEDISVKVVGKLQFDRFSGEQIIIAQSIEEIPKKIRVDNAPNKRIELHLHTKFSSMDGLLDVDACVKQVAEWGHKAVAITDHGVVQAFPTAYWAGKKYGIKIIYGVEGYLVADDRNYKNMPRYHVVIYAKNKLGLQNLYRLISLSHLKYFHRRPLIPKILLEQFREGLIVGTACEAGELIRNYLSGKSYDDLKKIATSYDFLEIQPRENNYFLIQKGIINSDEDLIKMNKTIVKLGKDLKKPVVATGDVHFLNKEDEVFRRILMAGQGYKDTGQAPLYLKTTEEMLEEFSYLSEEDKYAVVINNTHLISDMIEELTPIPDGFFPPNIEGADEEIKNMTWSNAIKIYGDDLPIIVKERIDKELEAIISNGYAVLYLISHKLVKRSNEDGFLVGSRGSVGSSLVATLTGITEVNPLPPHYLCNKCKYSKFINDNSVECGIDLPPKKCPNCDKNLATEGHQIPFEVFMGFDGDKVPDIDLNFSGEYQPLAHRYTEELFGSDKVFRAGTIATVAEKTAFGFVKKYLEEKNTRCRGAERDRLVKNCTGVKRTTGQHPGGLMIIPDNQDIYSFTPIQRPADAVGSNTITTHFDYHSLDDCLVKLDILGHDDPTVIKMLEDLTGIDAQKIPLNDKETMKIFSGIKPLNIRENNMFNPTVGTIGIPEFGTRFVRGMLEDTLPNTFSELVRISGLSHGTDVWLNNAQDLIKNKVASLNETIACRDDIMVYLIEKGLPKLESFKIMEDVRKGKGLKTEYRELMRSKNIPEWYINSCDKIKYMFPKAHAVAYVTMAFRIAYFKVNYPNAFYSAYFTTRATDFEAELICKGEEAVFSKMQEIEKMGNEATVKEKALYSVLEVALEMFLRGIKIRMVDLWNSEAFKFKIINEELLCPFITLQGLGEMAARNIMEARTNEEIKSIEDLQIKARLTKTAVQVLINNDIVKELPEKNQLTLF